MNPLPDRLNLDHLKKQAKQLIRLYRSRDPAAMARFRNALPAVAGRNDEDISSAQLRLHDAQSCIAREYGFTSWSDLKHYVEVQAATRKERGARILHWAQLLYSGDVSGTLNRANPRVGLRMLADDPELDRGRSLARLRDRRRKRAAAGDAGRSGMGQPARRSVAIAAALRGRAFEPAAGRRIPRAPASQRAIADRGRRRRQPAYPQPLAAGIAERTGSALSALDALWRGRKQPRRYPDQTTARCRRGPQ